jgi:hypothetical protein
MPVAGWFYRSFPNSFTLYLIWLACTARRYQFLAFDCAIFLFSCLLG